MGQWDHCELTYCTLVPIELVACLTICLHFAVLWYDKHSSLRGLDTWLRRFLIGNILSTLCFNAIQVVNYAVPRMFLNKSNSFPCKLRLANTLVNMLARIFMYYFFMRRLEILYEKLQDQASVHTKTRIGMIVVAVLYIGVGSFFWFEHSLKHKCAGTKSLLMAAFLDTFVTLTLSFYYIKFFYKTMTQFSDRGHILQNKDEKMKRLTLVLEMTKQTILTLVAIMSSWILLATIFQITDQWSVFALMLDLNFLTACLLLTLEEYKPFYNFCCMSCKFCCQNKALKESRLLEFYKAQQKLDAQRAENKKKVPNGGGKQTVVTVFHSDPACKKCGTKLTLPVPTATQNPLAHYRSLDDSLKSYGREIFSSYKEVTPTPKSQQLNIELQDSFPKSRFRPQSKYHGQDDDKKMPLLQGITRVQTDNKNSRYIYKQDLLHDDFNSNGLQIVQEVA